MARTKAVLYHERWQVHEVFDELKTDPGVASAYFAARWPIWLWLCC